MLTMKIITTLTFFILLHSSFTFANTHLIKINKNNIDLADYRYLTLSNGLKVVLMQKHGDSFEVAANVKFQVRMAGQTAYFCTYE